MDEASVVPQDLACWVLALQRGDAAQLTFQWKDPILSATPLPGYLMRLSASRCHNEGIAEQAFDCIVNIEHVAAGVRKFLQTVEQHPYLPSAWLYWEDVPMALEEEAVMYRQALPSDSLNNLDPDAIDATYIADHMQFTQEQQANIRRYRAKSAAAASSLL